MSRLPPVLTIHVQRAYRGYKERTDVAGEQLCKVERGLMAALLKEMLAEHDALEAGLPQDAQHRTLRRHLASLNGLDTADSDLSMSILAVAAARAGRRSCAHRGRGDGRKPWSSRGRRPLTAGALAVVQRTAERENDRHGIRHG